MRAFILAAHSVGWKLCLSKCEWLRFKSFGGSEIVPAFVFQSGTDIPEEQALDLLVEHYTNCPKRLG